MTTTKTFPRTTPSALDIDARGVLAFVDALESTPGVEPHSLMLLRHGQVAAEGWWQPYAADRVHLLYSLSKSFTAAAVGIAVREGLIDLDATALSYFPELDDEITDEGSRRIRVRHLLAMASGHREDAIDRAREADRMDVVRGFLLLPPDEEPGSLFTYNQPCTYTLAAIVRRVSGGSLVDYLRPRLLDPLGIDDLAWRRDESGGELGFSGCYTTTSAVAALGQLYLQRGVWEGERILDEDWVAAATRKQIDNLDEENPDWSQGYGFQFWMARHGFRGDGAYGQFCVVLPEHDVVLAITGQSLDMQAVLDAAWQHLLPAVDRPSDTGADTVLEARLASLGLPAVSGAAVPEHVAGRALRVLPGAALDAVGFDRGAHGIRLTVSADGASASVPVGEGEWAVEGALAASAATQPDGAVLVALRFVETPHLLHLRVDLDAGTVGTTWETEPLHDGALTLHRPAD
ncbi:CubicO group peptidase (beta-lactamase class C family) [Curtobacterium sp. PhB25]|uniref:serine hydrolase domain-containing protein n=1 Tax=unclassified Curtobacterium TaxID=257496 RepID=UPI001047167E|nr:MULTISPECIES: serine hydrolase [unclassified Curtobacterium]TCU84397.1 CubicO group peptidase (beta-lactamase class C family) [Curtobacterium sp. PhB191]TDW52979.1 CubicO group peptidase (beta-lactamase class C family) [Curtobacterium sp. PhB42]TDW58251.1 CubicO group peptidase (beta-lactamase class C family) [Curtobacterium sp. PhB190]TDW74563.1 CubicO group peptidase (beta-lactamase class C family) [Curtobacterium sp. PhB25]